MKNVLMLAAVTAALALSSQAHAEGWKDKYKTIRLGVLSGENEKDRIARRVLPAVSGKGTRREGRNLHRRQL